jgi:signal transduction histidine kinase
VLAAAAIGAFVFEAVRQPLPAPNVEFATLAVVALTVVALIPLLAIFWRPRIGVPLLWLGLVSLLVTSAARSAPGGDFALLVAVYTIATGYSWRKTAVACVIAVTGSTLAELLGGRPAASFEMLYVTAATAAAYALLAAGGLYLGRRRAFVRTLVGRTQDLERERNILETERDLMARRAVAVERARIARELHDVVAHHVSVMVIQAGAAEASLPPEAKAAGQAIEAIRETGREALTEMRRLLGLLRSEADLDGDPNGNDAGQEHSKRAPQPGLADLPALAERMREAGVDVAVEISGTARHLPAGIDLSVYRIVQEALTNTLRHAGPGSRARLRLTYGPDTVTVDVTDDGHGRPAAASVERPRSGVGHGLLGMRERVALFGGRLETGPLPGGGFRVLASFPLEAPDVEGEGKLQP